MLGFQVDLAGAESSETPLGLIQPIFTWIYKRWRCDGGVPALWFVLFNKNPACFRYTQVVHAFAE
jgi:hypothetical protein